MKACKLIMVSTENNNKFYNMQELSDGTFAVEYGRVEKTCIKESYSISLWDKKYREKLKKGYKDVTHLYSEVVSSTTSNGVQAFTPITNSQVKQLIDTLQAYAKKSIQQNYTVTSDKVTEAQVNEAQSKLTALSLILREGAKAKDLNEKLLELFHIIPRQMSNVKSYLFNDIKTKTDFDLAKKQLDREQDTLDVMAGQVVMNKSLKESEDPKEVAKTTTMLEAMGLIVEEADSKAVEMIKKMMGSGSKIFKRAFKVINKHTQERFENHVAKAKNKATHLLWHGSRNQNFYNILNTGLLIRPSCAQHCGSMWDDGIYGATESEKSLNYTDYSGASHSYIGGRSSQAFLALFNFHTGNQLIMHKHDSSCCSISKKVKAEGYDCVWAKKGPSLYRDEIIIYNSNQCTIQYLIEVG